MRRLAVAALAALAACSVKLEGAPCASDANCPADQRCDGAGVQPGRCVACEPDPACTADGYTCAGSNAIRECRTNAGGCRYSRLISCGTLACQGAAPSATCPCPANAGDIVADAAQGSAGAPFNPTGLSTPPQCRFRRLGDALAAASSNRTVRMEGWTATGGEMKFSAAATGESFPLTVSQGVTLTTADAPPAPARYVIEVDQAGATRPALQLDRDAAASGFTVRPGAGGSASAAVLVNCAQPGTQAVALTSLVLDGKGAFTASAVGDGVSLMGTCGVSATSLLVENASGAGVRVGTSFPVGGPAPVVSIAGSTIRGNADSGLVVSVDASAGKPSLSVVNNDITQNGAMTPRTDTTVVPNVTRRGGGVVLLQTAPSPLVFTGTRVHGNLYDQVLIQSSDLGWTLSGGATCDASSDVFTCYDAATPGGPWFGLAVLGGATVNVLYDSWPHAVPASGTDYYKTPASTVNASPACGVSTLTCP